MFCPNCGAASTQGLNYCKLCGANLSSLSSPVIPPPPSIPKTVYMLFAAILGFGLLAFGGLMAALSDIRHLPGEDERIATTIMLLSFGSLTILGGLFLFTRLLMRLSGLSPRHEKPMQTPRPLTFQQSIPQLPPPPSGIASVTENTTRSFDPVLILKKSENDFPK